MATAEAPAAPPRSPSPSPSPPRGLSRSPVRRRSGSRSRSPSRSRSRSRSPRSRSRSRSRSPDTRASKKLHLTLPVCRDFTRGRCMRSPIDCRYAHPPPTVSIDGSEVTVCYDSLRDRCTRGYVCRFFHPPPHLRAKMQEAAGIQGMRGPSTYQEIPFDVRRSSHVLAPPPLPASNTRGGQRDGPVPTLEVCRDFTRGRCARRAEDCRYAHQMPETGDGDYVVVCQDYLRGKCQRASCRYFHAPNFLRTQIKDRVLGSRNADYGQRGEYGPYGYNGAFYEHQSHFQGASLAPRPPLPPPPPIIPPPPRAPRDEDKLPVCRDFYLRGSCSRESSCRFVHPDSNVQVVDNYVTVCRDFVRGHCKRDQCRFYHPPESLSSQLRNGDADERKDNGNRSFVPEDTELSSPVE